MEDRFQIEGCTHFTEYKIAKKPSLKILLLGERHDRPGNSDKLIEYLLNSTTKTCPIDIILEWAFEKSELFKDSTPPPHVAKQCRKNCKHV